ncbi:MAG: hypothetical protein HS111_15405 [Kofleriaceae bacterium]|nr:hypothetical protein [Kofleriaceae bacterium]
MAAAVDAALAELVAALAAAARLYPAPASPSTSATCAASTATPACAAAGYARGAGDAVLRGGRYDELVGGATGGRRARSASLRRHRGHRPGPARGPGRAAAAVAGRALVVAADDVGRATAAAVAAALRAAGVRAAVDLATGAAAARLRYAAETGWTHVLELAAATAHEVAATTTTPIPATAITAAASGDGLALATILTGRS